MQITRFIERNTPLIVIGSMIECSLLVFLLATETNNWSWLPLLFFAPFGIYLGALFLTNGWDSRDSEKTLLIIGFAVAFRLTLLFSGPVFSFDMYRYYWDGMVAANGINPYVYSPDATELSWLRDANWELVNHKYLKTGYPPLMELFFELLYVSFHSMQSYKISFFLFDIGTILIILLMLRDLGADIKYLIVYAWAPLPIVEISQTGHNDSMAVFLMMASFFMLLRGRRNLSSALMGLSVISKLFPIFFVPVLFRAWGKKGALIFFLVVGVFHIPFADVGPRIYSGLLYAVNTSFFNGSVFPAVTALLIRTDLFANPGFVAQLVIYSIYGILLLQAIHGSVRQRVGPIGLMKTCFLLLGALLLFNRSFFPWYIAWVLPFIVFYASRSWLLLSGSIFLSYLRYDALPPPPYEGIDATVSLVLGLVQYLPFYMLFAHELFTRKILTRSPRDPQLP